MLFRLFLLFTLVPIVELYLLIRIGGWLGALPTVGLVLLTGVIGAWLARREGVRAWRDLAGSLALARSPAPAILAGVAVLAGGALLLTPGVLTDVVGLALLVPPVRDRVVRAVRDRLERRIARGDGGIEVRFWNPGPPPPS